MDHETPDDALFDFQKPAPIAPVGSAANTAGDSIHREATQQPAYLEPHLCDFDLGGDVADADWS